MNNFFVSVNGNRIASNLCRKQAISMAIMQHENNPQLCGLDIGIGRVRYKNGERVYSMVPYNYYI